MSESLRDKVAIVGAGCCQFGENWDKSREDMIVDACYEAYEDAGIENPQDDEVNFLMEFTHAIKRARAQFSIPS